MQFRATFANGDEEYIDAANRTEAFLAAGPMQYTGSPFLTFRRLTDVQPVPTVAELDALTARQALGPDDVPAIEHNLRTLQRRQARLQRMADTVRERLDEVNLSLALVYAALIDATGMERRKGERRQNPVAHFYLTDEPLVQKRSGDDRRGAQ